MLRVRASATGLFLILISAAGCKDVAVTPTNPIRGQANGEARSAVQTEVAVQLKSSLGIYVLEGSTLKDPNGKTVTILSPELSRAIRLGVARDTLGERLARDPAFQGAINRATDARQMMDSESRRAYDERLLQLRGKFKQRAIDSLKSSGVVKPTASVNSFETGRMRPSLNSSLAQWSGGRVMARYAATAPFLDDPCIDLGNLIYDTTQHINQVQIDFDNALDYFIASVTHDGPESPSAYYWGAECVDYGYELAESRIERDFMVIEFNLMECWH